MHWRGYTRILAAKRIGMRLKKRRNRFGVAIFKDAIIQDEADKCLKRRRDTACSGEAYIINGGQTQIKPVEHPHRKPTV